MAASLMTLYRLLAVRALHAACVVTTALLMSLYRDTSLWPLQYLCMVVAAFLCLARALRPCTIL